MAVTSFAYLKLITDSILPPDFIEKLDKVIDSQDALVADQQSTASESAGASQQRLVAFFQETKNPSLAVGIAEWPSIGTFKAWRGLAASNAAVIELAKHVDNAGKPTSYAVAEGSLFQDTTRTDGRISLLEAPYVEISRWLVPASKRGEFYSIFETLRRHRMSVDLRNVVVGSWGLNFSETPQETDLAEFFIVAGCDKPKQVEASDISSPGSLLKEIAVSFEIKHYTQCT